MHILSIDRKSGVAKLSIDSSEDLWILENILKDAEEVSAHSTRVYKLGGKEEKKHVFISISVDSVKYDENANRLRVLGVIKAGHPEEFVQIGRHHTIDITVGMQIFVKKTWHKYDIERIKKTGKYTISTNILVVLVDNESANFFIVSGERIKKGLRLYSGLHKSDNNYEEKKRSYFGRICSEIENYNIPTLVAGPGFVKNNLKTFISQKYPDLKGKIFFDSCSSTEINGVKELMKRGTLAKITGNFHVSLEHNFIDRFMHTLSTSPELAVYGREDVKHAYSLGALSEVMVAYPLLRKDNEIADIINAMLDLRSNVVIVLPGSDTYDYLNNFNGIIGLLRFRMH